MNNSIELALSESDKSSSKSSIQSNQEITERLINALITESEEHQQPVFTTLNNQFRIRRIVLPSNRGILTCVEANERCVTVYLSVILIKNDGEIEELDAIKLLNCILELWEADEDCCCKIRKEVNNCLENLSFAFEHEAQHLAKINKRIEGLLAAKLSTSSQREAFLHTEIIPFKGHPIHVCSKTKLGFSKTDALAYNPEFSPVVKLQLVAVHRSHVVHSTEIGIWTDYISSHLKKDLPEDYIVFPVHPWQYENIASKEYRNYFASGVLIALEESALSVCPTLSLRTALLPITSNQNLYHVKVPINIQATSIKRSLTFRDLYNGIEFSKFISTIAHNLPSLASKRGRIVTDLCAAHFDTPQAGNPALSFLLRNDPINSCLPGETMIVAATLVHSTKLQPTPLLCRLIRQSAIPVAQYIDQLFGILLAMPLEIFLQYGIALDLHGQNTMLVFDQQHQVQALAYRDLGSIQVSKTNSLLGNQYQSFYGETSTFLSHQEAVSELTHTLYNHLIGEIITCIAQFFCIPTQTMWQKVKKTSISIINACDAPQQAKDRLSELLFAPTLNIKPLLKMRIHEKTLYHPVPNPMANTN